MSAVRVEAAGPAHTDGLVALFEAASSPCFCRFWHFAGTKNEWLDRCASRPEENARELEQALARGDASASGLVALVAPAPAPAPTSTPSPSSTPEEAAHAVGGWLKLAPRATLPKLRALPVYRGLDLGPEDTTFSVGCLLVHPRLRRRGVARALLASAPAYARARGARAIEAYPRRSSEPLHDEEVWQGPERVFRELGWLVVADVAPYPVYRKVLAPQAVP